MLFHQRIDYSPPSPTQRLYLRIPTTSTLWTFIETSTPDRSHSTVEPHTAALPRSTDEPHTAPSLRSGEFPSRILEQENFLSVVFSGVDMSCLLKKPSPGEYRIIWRTVSDPQDPDPKDLISIPLESPVVFTFAYGNSSLLSLGLGGVDVTLHFDRTTRTLSTSWFIPPLITSWTLGLPKRIMTRLLKSYWQPLWLEYQARTMSEIEDPRRDHIGYEEHLTPGPGRAPPLIKPYESLWAKLTSLCCRHDAD